MQKYIEFLTLAFPEAVLFNWEVQGALASILWLDRDRQWEEVSKTRKKTLELHDNMAYVSIHKKG